MGILGLLIRTSQVPVLLPISDLEKEVTMDPQSIVLDTHTDVGAILNPYTESDNTGSKELQVVIEETNVGVKKIIHPENQRRGGNKKYRPLSGKQKWAYSQKKLAITKKLLGIELSHEYPHQHDLLKKSPKK